MKILLGGVPFGCGNIGDDAILNCTVAIFRRNLPQAELTAVSGRPDADRLKYQINTIPFRKLDPRYNSRRALQQIMRNFDLYVWAGAGGLSDYPKEGACLLECAQAAEVHTMLWQVGMNHEFGSGVYQQRGILRLIEGMLHLRTFLEKKRINLMRKRLKNCISRCDLVIMRDQSSLIELHAAGEFPAATFGTDPAVLQQSGVRQVLQPDQFGRRTIGIGFSARRITEHLAGWLGFFERLRRELKLRIVFIPMNPAVDQPLMERLKGLLPDSDDVAILDCLDPEDAQQAAGACDLLLSNRLHLILFGLNRMVPGIGIAGSSKIANLLSLYGLQTVDVRDPACFERLFRLCQNYLHDPEFPLRARAVRERLLGKLAQSEESLRNLAKRINPDEVVMETENAGHE